MHESVTAQLKQHCWLDMIQQQLDQPDAPLSNQLAVSAFAEHFFPMQHNVPGMPWTKAETQLQQGSVMMHVSNAGDT